MDDDIKALRDALEARGVPEEWIAGNDDDSDYSLIGTHDGDRLVSQPVLKIHDERLADYIAAANPARIARLLDRLEAETASRQAAQLENERLKAELAKRPTVNQLVGVQARLEAAEADAARYRWLRDDLYSDWAICEWSHDEPDGIGYYRDARAADVVDAAIDQARAAMQAKKPTPQPEDKP